MHIVPIKPEWLCGTLAFHERQQISLPKGGGTHSCAPSRKRGGWLEGWQFVVVLLILGLALPLTAASAQTFQEVRIRWDTYSGAVESHVAEGARQTSNHYTLIGRRTIHGSSHRQRNPEFSSDQIVVVAVDNKGKEIDWQLAPDPRLLRAEVPDSTGQLRSEVLHRTSTELLITLPDDPAIVQVHLYHPRWTGKTFAL